MRYILNAVYLALLLIYLPIIFFQRVVSGKKRPGLWSKMIGSGPTRQSTKKCILFHAVSLGEVNALNRLVQEFRNHHPDWEVVVSTTTQTGLEAAQKSFADSEVCLLPFDFTWATKRFLRNLKPDVLVLAELEIWPNLLNECKRRSIATCLVNARLNEKSHAKYSRLIRWIGNVFGQLDHVCCQNKIYAERFQSLGVPDSKITLSGNLKYDSLLDNREQSDVRRLREMVGIRQDELVLIAGSTQAPEEQLVIDAYQTLEKNYPNLRLLICPRHPERFDEVASIIGLKGIRYSRRSQLDQTAETASSCERVVLLDCMGELKHWWGVGDVAFVGGSFGNRGGQNMIEPLALGNAVCFGPNTRNFAQEVAGLNQYQASVQLYKTEELLTFITTCLDDPEFRVQLTKNGRTYLKDHSSEIPAWRLTLNSIESLMNERLGKLEQGQNPQAA